MRIGICAEIDHVLEVERSGFDFIELPLQSFSELNASGFTKFKQTLFSTSLKSEASNLFFPANFILTGPHVDMGSIKEYNKIALDRARQLGVSLVVVGCGPQRKYPDGWSREDAVGQFGEILAHIGDEAEQYEITVTIEPIRSSSTNIVNTLYESDQLVQQLNHPRVRLMVDTFQMIQQSESLEVIEHTSDAIKHIHISDTQNRKCPTDRYEDNYDEVFKKLQNINYRGAMTIEAGEFSATEAAQAVQLLREMAAEYRLV